MNELRVDEARFVSSEKVVVKFQERCNSDFDQDGGGGDGERCRDLRDTQA